METRSMRKRKASAGQEQPASPLPPIPNPPSSQSPSPTDHKRSRSNHPPRLSYSASISSVDPASQGTWQEQKKLAETRIDEYKDCSRPNEKGLAKTLRAALNWLPQGGRDQLAKDIIDVDKDDEALWAVFDNLRTAVIEAFRSIGKTSYVTPSPYDSRQASVDKVAAKLPDLQVRSSDFVDDCKDRDNHRCVISGAVTESEWVEVEGPLWGKLEVHHIIPFSLGGFEDEDHREVTIKWASIYTAFPQIKAIRASKINTIENGITLHYQVHDEFQAFRLALQPTETADCYSVKKYRRFNSVLHPHVQRGAFVTLRQAAGHQDKPLPNRDFLDTHFRLCEIFHTSGLADEVEYNAKRWDQMQQEGCGRVLQEDGSTNLTEFLQVAFFGVA